MVQVQVVYANKLCMTQEPYPIFIKCTKNYRWLASKVHREVTGMHRFCSMTNYKGVVIGRQNSLSETKENTLIPQDNAK